MFSDITSFLDSFGIAKHIRRRGLNIFSRRRWLGRRSELAGTSQGFTSLSGIEPLEVKKLFAVDIDLVGTVLTVAFDDTSADVLTLSINSTGYVATGANTSFGSGTITELVVIDAGTKNTSSFTLANASQTLGDGLSIDQNITSASLATAVDAGSGNVTIHAASLTLGGNITSGPQIFSGNVTLAGDVTLTSTGSESFDYANPVIAANVSTAGNVYAVEYSRVTPSPFFYVAQSEAGMAIYSIGTGLTGTYALPGADGYARDLEISADGNYAFLAVPGTHVNNLQIVDVSDPSSPFFVGGYTQNGTEAENLYDVALSSDGTYAYLAYNTGDYPFQIVNVSNLANPTLVGSYNGTVSSPFGYSEDIELSSDGRYAFVASDGYGLQIIDVSNPASPTLAGNLTSLNRGNTALDLALSSDGQYAFVAAARYGLQIIDVSDVANPQIIGQINTPGWAGGVAIAADDRYVFLADGYESLLVIDVADPANPSIYGNVAIEGGYVLSATVAENIVFVADEAGGVKVVAVPSVETGGTITFGGTVDGPHGLTVNAAGETTFSGAVGGTTPLASLTTDANGTTTLGGNVTTSGNQTYGDVVNLAAATTLTGLAGAFAGGAEGNDNDLTLNFTDSVAIAGGFTGIANLTSTGDATLCGNITTSGVQSYEADVELVCNTTLTSIGSSVPDYTNGAIVGGFGTSSIALGVTLSSDGRYAFVADYTAGLQIVDVSNVASPTLAGSLDTSGVASDVALSADGRYAFIADYAAGLQIIDVSNVAAPTLAGNLALGDSAYQVTLSPNGRYAFVADGLSGLQIVDVLNVAAPTLVGNLDTSGAAYGVTLSADGQYAFIADSFAGLQIIDVSNVAAPTLAGNLATTGLAYGVTLSADGQYAFIADYASGLQIIDVSNVAAPTLAGSLDTSGLAYGVTLSADSRYAFIADYAAGLQIIDVSNVAAPTLASSLDTSGFAYGVTLSADGRYAFIGDGYNGLQIVEFPGAVTPSAVLFGSTVNGNQALTVNANVTTFSGEVGDTTPLESLTTDANGTTTLGGNVTTSGNQTYGDLVNLTTATTLTGATGAFAAGVAGNDNDLTLNFTDSVAIAGGFTGIANLTSTGDATLEGNITTSGNQVYHGSVDIIGDAELTTTGQTVYDYSNLSIAGTYDSDGPAADFALSADGNYAFVADGGYGLVVLNIADISNPTKVSELTLGVDAIAIAVSADDRYAYIVDGSNSLTIVDLANLAAPVSVGNTTAIGPGTDIVVSADAAYAYVAAGTYGLQVISVANVAAPSLIGSYNSPGGARRLALAANGTEVFLADTFSGLKIINVTNPASPTLTGGVDTSGFALGVAVSADNQLTYVADGASGLQVVNTSVFAAPTLLGKLNTAGIAQAAALAAGDQVVFLGDGTGGLITASVQNSSAPNQLGSLNLSGATTVALAADGSYAVVADGFNGIRFVSIAAALQPGNVAFGSTVDGGHSLSISVGDGTATFGGAVGSRTPLASLTTTANTTAIIAGGTIETTGNQTYGGVVNLAADAELIGDTGSFAAGVEGNTNSLTLNFTNELAIGDGFFANLTNLTSIGDFATNGTISTINNQTYLGGLTLLGDTTLTGNGAMFTKGVVGAANDLTLNFADSVAIAGGFTGIANLTSTGDATLCGNVTTSGAQDYQGDVELVCDVILTSTGSSSGWVSNYADPTLVAQVLTSGPARQLMLSSDEQYAFIANADGAGGMTIADVSDPLNPSIVSTTITGRALQVAVSPDGQLAFVASILPNTMQVFNVSDPSTPTQVANVSTGGSLFPYSVELSQNGSLAYLGLAGFPGTQQFRTYNVANASSPTLVGTANLTASPYDIDLSADGRYAFVATDTAGLTVVNLAGGTPTIVSVTDTPGNALSVALSQDGMYAFIADNEAGVQIFDISNLASPALIGNVATPGTASAVTLSADGEYLFVADVAGGLRILDISNATAPVEIGSLDTPGDAIDSIPTADGKYVFVADALAGGLLTVALGSDLTTGSEITFGGTVNGNQALTVNANVTTFSGEVGDTTPLESLTTDANGTTTLGGNVTTSGNQTYGDLVNLTTATTLTGLAGAFADGVTGNDNDLTLNFTDSVAIAGGFTGIANLTSTGDATLCGNITTSGVQSYEADVELLCNTTLTSTGGSIDYADGSLVGNLDTSGNAYGVTLSADGRYAFIADGPSGLQIVDVSNVAAPTLAGSLDTSGLARGVTLSADGRYAFIADGSSGLQIIDVSNVAAPALVGNVDTSGFAYGVSLSADGGYAFIADGSRGLQIIDVSNVAAPTLTGNLDTDGSAVGVMVSADGRYAFIADCYYGLQIIDVSNVATPTLAGNLDTSGVAYGVTLSADGGYAFIADGSGLQIIDVSNVATPTLAGNLATTAFARGVTLSADGRYALLANGNSGLQVIDVSNVSAPALAGNIATTGFAQGVSLSADGLYAYIADSFDGLQIVEFPGANPSAVLFDGTVDGGYTLTVNDGENGTTTFSGEVGGTTPLTSLTTNANGTTTLAANVTVAGPIIFGDNVTLLGNTTVTSDDASFGGTVDGGYGLVVNSGPDGTTHFAQPIGGTTPLASLSTNPNGTTTLGGGSVTTTGNQSYGDTVRLIRNTTLVSGAGTITTAAVTDGPEGFGLTVGDANQTGAVVLGGNLSIGSVTAAAGAFDVSLTGANNSLETATFTNTGNLTLGSSASSRTFVSGGLAAPGVAKTFLAGSVVTDSGAITLNATSLTANAVLDSTNGGVSNGAAILLANGTELNGFRLETFGGQSDTELTGDTEVSDGELIVETGSLNLGTPSQPGTLTATQDTLIQVANGALNVYAGSTIAAGNNALTLQLDDLNVAAGAGNITAGSITVRPSTIGRDIFLGSATGSGLVVNQNAFDSFQTPLITIGTAGYNGTVNAGNLAVPQGRLDIIANGTGGTVLFEGDFVSTATGVPGGIGLFVEGSGATTTINGTITSAGAVVINDALVTDGNHTIDTSGTNANITITGGTTGIYGASGETNSLTIKAGTGAVILGNQTGFGDNAGSGSLLENVTISAGSTRLGATTSEINGTFSVTSGTLLLAGNLAAGAVNVSSTAGLTLVGNATVTAVGNVAFAGTVDGPFALAVASNATTNFAAAVGDTTPLADLTLTGGTTRLGGDVTTTGNQSYATDLVLDGPTGLTGAFGSFNGDLDGNGNILVLDFTSETTIGAGGSFTNLAELVSLGDVAINGTIATTGLQNYLGNVSLTGATTIAASNLGLATGVTGNNQNLTLNIAATMPINSSLAGIGNLTSLGNVALDGVITTTGFQNYAAAATLAADTTLNATGNIDFGSRVDGARLLNIRSGGNVNLFAALGSTTPLQGLNLASAATVTALGTLAINGTGGTGAGLRIGNGVNNVNISQPGSTITGAALSGILLAGNTTGSTIGGFTITKSGSHGIEAAGGSYTGTTVENSSVTSSAGDGFHAANATGLTATLLHSAANSKAGIRVAGTSSNVTISNSLVGLNANGTAAQPNLGQGIVVSAATGTLLQGNTISGNGFYGVVVNGAAANTTISGNRIGIGTDGTTAIGNGQSGVFVLAGATGTSIVGNQIRNNNGMAGIQVVDGTSNTTIGGRAGDSNLLVGNGLFGITVSGNVPGTRILGNLVSSHTTANLYLNNAQNLTVGSATSGEDNTFDGSDYGVYAGGDLTGTTIQGNTFQQHTLGGMVLTNAGNLTVRDNTVDDNGAYGIYGTGDLTGTTLQGNTISNQTVGVLVDNGANLTIGSGTGTAPSGPDANVITKNTSAGIVVNGAGSQNVSILSNSIFGNDFIGISLSAGGNALARTPTLATASTTRVTGSISGTNGDVFRIQYFKSSAAVTSSSRFAQGQELIGYQDVTIAGGTASIDYDLTGSGVIVTDWITATATLLVGGLPSETSQFSFGIRVTA